MAPRARGLIYPGPLKNVTFFVLVLALVLMRAPLTVAFQGFVRARTSAAAASSSRAALSTFSTLATPSSTAQSLQQSSLARHVRAATAMAARKKNEEDGSDEAAAAATSAAPAARKSKPTADDKKIGRGPRNRRQIAASAEEEEFAALSDSRAPVLGADGLPRGRPRIASRSTGPPKKRPAMTFDPTWTAKGSSSSSSSSSGGGGKASMGSSTKKKAEEEKVRPPVAAVPSAMMEEGGKDEDEDEMDGELLDLPKGMKIRALDSKSYEEARRLANLSDDEGEEEEEDWEEEEDEEEEYSDEEEEEEEEEKREALPDDIVFGDDDDEDDDELPPLPPGKVLSMEERLRMAETGNIFNPYVARMHTKSGPPQSQASKSLNSNSNNKLFEELGYEEGDEDEVEDDMSPDDAFAFERRPMRPVKYQYKIVMDVGTCPGCGNSFQTKNDSSPGFLPPDVFQRMQSKMMTLRKTQPLKQQPGAVPLSKSAAGARRKQQQMEAAAAAVAAGLKEEGREDGGDLYQGMTAEEEVEMLLSGKDRDEVEREEEEGREGGKGGKTMIIAEDEEVEEEEEEGREDKEEDEEDDDRTVICQRCHKLKHYGEVEDSLRPGWTDNEALTPERFRDLVSVIRKKRCAVVCLVDIFDFHGSLLYNLPRIVGENPVLIAVNKADLLPSDFSEERVRIWVKQELEKVGMKEVNTRHIHLISCKTGANVKPLLRAMKLLARQRKRDLYVIGAANVGKSTFINRLIELGRSGGDQGRDAKKKKKKQDPSKAAGTSLVTTSPLPGTTLNFIEVDLGDKVSLYDTPGLILPHQITTLLNTEELKAVIPQKRINHVTLRLKEGKSVLLGGLVRLDMVEGRPFLFTFYVSNDVKLHQTATDRADEFLDKHIGDLVFPPFTQERRAEMGPWVARDFDIEGTGWKTSAIDIVISGLGWISITGALNCKVRVMAPEAVGVRLRSPLMPYETWATTAKWTGLRAIKSDKQKGSSR